MKANDPRLHAIRPDMVDEALRQTIPHDRYVRGVPHTIGAPLVTIRDIPDNQAAASTQALFGEGVNVFVVENNWAWGQLHRDNYVGYFPSDALLHTPPAPTHRITALLAHLYPEPSIKSQALALLPFAGTCTLVHSGDKFSELQGGGFICNQHIAPIDAPIAETDYVTLALHFIGTPYLWGGKTALGIDCSGLVQIALQAQGRMCLRDSDMQEETLGRPLDESQHQALQRGDLVFWPGHVGIMVDGLNLLHANATHMKTVIEPLSAVTKRSDKPIRRINRFTYE